MNCSKMSLLAAAVLTLLSVSVAQQTGTIDDKDVEVVHYENLIYPVWAQMDHIQGVVVIRAQLDGDGNVVDATALSGASLLVPESIKNARKWKFRSNSQNGALIVYNFRIGVGCKRKSPYSEMTFYPPNFALILNCRNGVSEY